MKLKLKLKVIKVDKLFSKKNYAEIKINDLVEVYRSSWKKPGNMCIIKKDDTRFWYPKDCLIELNSMRNNILDDLGI